MITETKILESVAGKYISKQNHNYIHVNILEITNQDIEHNTFSGKFRCMLRDDTTKYEYRIFTIDYRIVDGYITAKSLEIREDAQ
jgi:hypothetical protein